MAHSPISKTASFTRKASDLPFLLALTGPLGWKPLIVDAVSACGGL
jgi:hypothetical protein